MTVAFPTAYPLRIGWMVELAALGGMPRMQLVIPEPSGLIPVAGHPHIP